MPHRNLPPNMRNLQLNKIRNRVEKMVIASMVRLFENVSAELLMDKDICDIYALALNRLPCQYAQPGTIVLGRLPEQDVDDAVQAAYDSVVDNPKS